MPGCFVTGTDTGVGKTVVTAAIVARLRRDGVAVRPFKPLITGLSDPVDVDWPPDHVLLAQASGMEPRELVLRGYDPPVSPHLAAELVGDVVPPAGELAAEIRRLAGGGDAVAVVEGVGGLLVPLGPGEDVRTLARELGLPVVIAARPGLGTISHTLLTIEAARAAELPIAGVVLTPWPEQPSVMESSNRRTIAERGAVEVATLPWIARGDPELLADAAQALPLRRWLAGSAGV